MTGRDIGTLKTDSGTNEGMKSITQKEEKISTRRDA